MAGGFGMSNQISNWAGGAATTTLGAAQLAYGLYLDKKNKRPEYQLPPEIAQNLTEAQQQALQGLPEEQKQQYISNIQRSQAYSMSQLGSRRAGIAGVAALNENQNNAYANLLAQDASARMARQQEVQRARQTLADYKDEMFQLNKLNPYYEMRQKAQGLMGAGLQNIGSGLQGTPVDSGNFSKGMDNPVQYGNQQRMSQPQAQQVQTFEYDPYQTYGVNQNTTPNPYSNEQEITGLIGKGSYY